LFKGNVKILGTAEIYIQQFEEADFDDLEDAEAF